MNEFREKLKVNRIFSNNVEYKESIEARIAKAVWIAIDDLPCNIDEEDKKAEIMGKINRTIFGIEENEERER